MLRALITLSFWAVASARGQEFTGPPELQAQLDKLTEVNEGLQQDLPNITCKQTATSQKLRDDKVTKQIMFEAELTSIRMPDGKLKERRKFLTVDGIPATGQKVSVPYLVTDQLTGAFSTFSTEARKCLTYSGNSTRIDFQTSTGTPPECTAGVKGFATFDAAGNMTHVERRIPLKAALPEHKTPFGSIDVHVVELNGKAYQLPSFATSDYADGKNTLRFNTHYEQCRLYKGSITILPGVTVVPDGEPEVAPHP